METFDVIIIGAGHNGLVCAAYLLKAGYQVLVLEKRAVPGGAATTEEAMPKEAPGFKFNLCAIDHEFIHLSPVIKELELNRFGLEYLYCDPVVFCPHPDGKYFLGHRSVEQTCANIAQYNPQEAQRYREFIDYWQQIVNALIPMFNAPPKSIIDIAGGYNINALKDVLNVVGSPNKALDFVRTMLTSAEDLLDEWLTEPWLKAPLARLSAELGMAPSQKSLAIGAMMMSLRHNPGMARPRGGTGALVDALVKCVRHYKGVVLTEQTVEKVLVDNGKAVGVRIANGKEYRAKHGVISNIDAKRLFLNLVDPADIDSADPKLRHRLDKRIINNNESLLKIDCALSEPLKFEQYNHQDDYLIGSILIADSVEQVETAHHEAARGRIPDQDPSMYVVMPTQLDPSMAPEGKHTLWIEFFAPYQIAGAENTGLNGTGWTDTLKNQVADRVLEKLADYSPNLKHSVIARRVESPAELGERLGAYRGNYYHVDMSLEQMVFLRPLPEIANYKTPIKGLFLTGAGTHPGGSISGMPGRNCARTFLKSQKGLSKALEALGQSVAGIIPNF
ncbi:zeta-carotene desaturase [Crocosphaera subtropica ATCC 51142]|uniref:Pyridine nucleotide-disulfide oxidoreductase domain-containing protein 2 n=1 Tax=Crocosphaera subtropica (strain ATCC 51142 / BH68) TaxID=43989 RepID=B1WSP7_CROS5|nr:NAD(P)/FAD-dependent oxidoreductase [Crocosphaera subtropica]ACB53626.1 zeta-carotene desaturase [Crocosphaera subtropica ATCC 51142]